MTEQHSSASCFSDSHIQKLFKKHKLQKNKMTISICSTQQHNDLPLAVSPLLLFRFRIMMTRPSPSLRLHGAPVVPIEMER
jgi:hypothetical protein